MFVWLVSLSITAPATTIAAFEEGEAATTTRHATTCTTDYTPEDREND